MAKYLVVRPDKRLSNIAHRFVSSNSEILSFRSFIHNFLLIPEGSLPFAPNVGLPEDYLDLDDLKNKLSNKFGKYGRVRVSMFEENGEKYIVVSIGDDVVSIFGTE